MSLTRAFALRLSRLEWWRLLAPAMSSMPGIDVQFPLWGLVPQQREHIMHKSSNPGFHSFSRCHAKAAIAFAAASTCLGASAQSAPLGGTAEAYAPGRILVMPRAGLSEVSLAGVLRQNGAGKARRVGKSELQILELPAGQEKAMVAKLQKNPHFKFAELDRYVPPAFFANDPYAGSAWHISKVGAATAWDTSQGAGVVIAVLDTGVDATHPDLAANMVPGWNVFNNNSNTSDFYGHGTPVAGTAAGITNNGIGVSGMAGRSRIMPLVITDSTASSYYSVIAQAITYAADHGARVASISFSGLPFSTAVQSAAQYMKNKGGLVVVAAGNTGAVDNVAPTTTMISVAATESNDARSTFSTFGAFVAMSAPGSGIYSTGRGGVYGTYGGTSFSTPIVAGTIALMMAANPRLSSAEVENLLFKTAIDLGAAGRDPYFGFGRVNTAAAVQAAKAAIPASVAPADTTPPTVAIAAPLGASTVAGLVPIDVSAADNVGVSKVELRVNGSLVATDAGSPFAFSWDSRLLSNGTANLVVTAYDAAGNAASSAPVAVNVSNATVAADTAPPSVTILSPTLSAISGSSVLLSDSATDNFGTAAISQSVYVNGRLMATAAGASLSYKWNTRNLKSGTYTVQFVAKDAAGNQTTASTVLTK